MPQYLTQMIRVLGIKYNARGYFNKARPAGCSRQSMSLWLFCLSVFRPAKSPEWNKAHTQSSQQRTLVRVHKILKLCFDCFETPPTHIWCLELSMRRVDVVWFTAKMSVQFLQTWMCHHNRINLFLIHGRSQETIAHESCMPSKRYYARDRLLLTIMHHQPASLGKKTPRKQLSRASEVRSRRSDLVQLLETSFQIGRATPGIHLPMLPWCVNSNSRPGRQKRC